LTRDAWGNLTDGGIKMLSATSKTSGDLYTININYPGETESMTTRLLSSQNGYENPELIPCGKG
jgi:hypothetical protein